MAQYETLSRSGFTCEIASDSNFATIYDGVAPGHNPQPKPVGTMQRRRAYALGPVWTAYDTDGTEITSGDYAFGVFKRFCDHYAAHTEDTRARASAANTVGLAHIAGRYYVTFDGRILPDSIAYLMHEDARRVATGIVIASEASGMVRRVFDPILREGDCSNRQVWGQPRRAYQVTIYNQHAGTSHTAKGRTRREAFNRALGLAGEAWLRMGGDKLTTLRTLFAESILAPYYRTAPHCYASHPNGAGVEFRRMGP